MSIMVLIDADSIVYAAGHASQKQHWRVWNRADMDNIDECESIKFFDNKTKLNAWLKSQGSDSRKMEKIENAAGKVVGIMDTTYYCHGSIKVESEAACLHSVKSMLKNIVKKSGASDRLLYLTKGGGFRKEIYPEYKMNRDETSKPIYYDLIREYMIKHWDAEVYDDLEADDAVAMDTLNFQETCGMNSVILASIDKDLNQVPGWHYNYQRELDLKSPALYFVTPEEGRKCFFRQMLTGDATDNIKGIPRVGDATADKMLAHCTTLDEYMAVIDEAYAVENAAREKAEEMPLNIELNASLLFMRRRTKDDNWRDFV